MVYSHGRRVEIYSGVVWWCVIPVWSQYPSKTFQGIWGGGGTITSEVGFTFSSPPLATKPKNIYLFEIENNNISLKYNVRYLFPLGKDGGGVHNFWFHNSFNKELMYVQAKY